MRAVVLTEFGPPENLEITDVPDPEPGPGQVLIEVEIANITFVETQVRGGRAPVPAMAPRLPVILGNGVGGTITAVGPGGDSDQIGQRVISTTGGSAQPDWADRVSRPVDVVFDGVGGEIARTAFGLLRDAGRMCMYGAASGSFAQIPENERGIRLFRGAPVSPEQMRELTTAALTEAAANRLRPTIGQTFPLARAADAHRAIQNRATVGKTLLLVSAKPGGPR